MTFNTARYTLTIMILSFNCKETQSLFEGGSPKRFSAFAAQAQRKLEMLAAAHAIEDLRSPPGNRFEWSDQGAQRVEIVDYH